MRPGFPASAGQAGPGISGISGVEKEKDMGKRPTDYLNARDAAAHLGLSTRTLDRYRVSGEGPVFLRFGGRVRYLAADLDEWARTRRRRSTSDDGSGERPPPAPPAADRDTGSGTDPGGASGSKAGTGRARRRAKAGTDGPGPGADR